MVPKAGSHLDFGSEGEIAGIAEAGDDIALGGELVVDGAAPNFALGLATEHIFNAYGTGDGDDDMDLGGMAFFAQELDGLDEQTPPQVGCPKDRHEPS